MGLYEQVPHTLVPMIRRATTLLALLCALSLAVPVLAGAATGGTPSQAISDCNSHDKLTAYYSPSVLRAALARMPSDVKEYTDCYDVIEQQLFKEIGKTSPGRATARQLEQLVPTDVADRRDRRAGAGGDHLRGDRVPAPFRRARRTRFRWSRRRRAARRGRWPACRGRWNARPAGYVTVMLCVRL